MSSLIVDNCLSSWFSENPEYHPIRSASNNSPEATKTGDEDILGKSVTKEGRKYIQISCQKNLTVLERTGRLVALVAITILTAFTGLFFQSVRNLWSEAIRGKVAVDVLFKASSSPENGETGNTPIRTTPSGEDHLLDREGLEESEMVRDQLPYLTNSDLKELKDEFREPLLSDIPVTATVLTNPLVQQIELLLQDEYLKSLSQSADEIDFAIEALRPDAMAKNVPAILKIMWFRALQKNDERLQNCVKILFSLNKAQELFDFIRALQEKSQRYHNTNRKK